MSNEILDVFLNEPSYNLSSYETYNIFVSASSYLNLTVKSSVDCDITIYYAVDENYDYIKNTTYAVSGGINFNKSYVVETRYVKFIVDNFSSTPLSLQFQLFHYNTNEGLTTLDNTSSVGQELYLPTLNEIKTLQSSDASITITDNGDNLDLISNATEYTASSGVSINAGTIKAGFDIGTAVPNTFVMVDGYTYPDNPALTVGQNSTSIQSLATGMNSVLVGYNNFISGAGGGAVAIGNGNTVGDNSSIIGYGSQAYDFSVALGGSSVAQSHSVAIGGLVDANTINSIVVGYNSSSNSYNNNITIGNDSYGGNQAVVIGNQGSGDGAGQDTVIIGNNTNVSGTVQNDEILLGRSASTTGRVGGVSFGSREAVSASNNWADSFIPLNWNGNTKYVVAQDTATVPAITASPFERNMYTSAFDHYAIMPITKNDNVQIGTYYNGAPSNTFNKANGCAYICSTGCSSATYDDTRNSGHCRIGCLNCTTGAGGGFGGSRGDVMISCDGCNNRGQPHTVMINCTSLNYNPYNQDPGYSTFISVDGSTTNVQRNNNHTIFLGCNNIVDNLGTAGALNYTFIHGSRFRYNGASSGFTCLGDNSGTATSTSITNNNSMVCRFAAGYRYYTNDGLTTGTVLTGGSSSWASVCDVNKKENLSVLDTNDILIKICSIPVYKYNYIGEPVERVCYSCTAQDYHSTFNTLDYQKPRYRLCTTEDKENCPPECNENCEIPVLDEEGNQIYDTVEAKDKLVIEQMDLIGLLMSSVQELKKQVDALNDRITILEGQ